MLSDPHSYAMDFFAGSRDGKHLGRSPLTVDWEPAREWTRMLGIRRGLIEPGLGEGDAEVVPVWNRTAGEPYISGFQVRVTCPGAGGTPDARELTCEFTTAYMSGLATSMSAVFIQQGLLKPGEYFRYLVSAVRKPPEAVPARGRLFSVKTVTPALAFKESSLVGFNEVSTPSEAALPSAGAAVKSGPPGTANTGAGRAAEAAPATGPDGRDMPVFIHERVMSEAKAQAKGAGSMETGGVLIGHLHLDRSAPEAFIEVTAHIPADHARSELTRLGFTPEVWAAVRSEVERRGKSEVWLGYWHAHNYMRDTCRNCKKAGDGSCKTDPAFFSFEDAMLLRTVFPRAYSVGLVIGESPCLGTTLALYGYDRGMIARRGWRVLNGKAQGAVPAKAAVAVPLDRQTREAR